MIRNICRKNHMQNENDWRQFFPPNTFFQASNSSSTTVVPSTTLEVWDSHPPGEPRAQVTSTDRLQRSPRTHPDLHQGMFCCFFPSYVRPKGAMPFSPRASWWTAATTPMCLLRPGPSGLSCRCNCRFRWVLVDLEATAALDTHFLLGFALLDQMTSTGDL